MGDRFKPASVQTAEFEERVKAWALGRRDIEALVLGGSRAAGGSTVDAWSDWDFQVITSRPRDYCNSEWPAQIAPYWCAHGERSPRGIFKVSVVFDRDVEADFMPLAAWQIKLVYFFMRYPGWRGMPRGLRRGIGELRGFLNNGARLFKGGPAWEKRLLALALPWPETGMEEGEFVRHHAAFWQKAVSILKKIARQELRSAMHLQHLVMVEHVYPLLREEARLEGRAARGEARKAEHWLSEERRRQTAMATVAEPAVLAGTLNAQMTLFQAVSASVAARRGFPTPADAEVGGWLRAECARLAAAR